MNLVEVTLQTTEVEPGWPLTADGVPLGKRYLVDLDRIADMVMVNPDVGRVKSFRCIWVVSPEPAGWLPTMAFGLEP